MRNEFAAYLREQCTAQSANKVAVLTGDLGFSVLEPLQQILGRRFINVGVAEALMTSMAAALAAEGFKVFTYSITPFATFRCLEQIRNDVCYHNLDVTVVGVGAGFGYGTLGPTHHSTEDLACMWALPNMQIYSPADLREARACYAEVWQGKGPKYLRLGKGGEGHLIPPESSPVPPFLPVLEYASGTDVTVITFGAMVKEGLAAARNITQAHGAQVQVLSCPQLKPFPHGALLEMITSRNVVIAEELNPYGGFGSMVCKTLLLAGPERWRGVKVVSAADRFASVVGSMAFQRAHTGLTQETIEQAIRSVLEDA